MNVPGRVWCLGVGAAACGELRPADRPSPEQVVMNARKPVGPQARAVPAAPPEPSTRVEPATPEAATSPGCAEEPRMLWVQFDDPFVARGERRPATATLTVDGAPWLTLELRAQGNPMTHRHWGQAQAPLPGCGTGVVFGVQVGPTGLREQQTLDLTRGAYLVLKHDARAGRVRVTQHRTRPLYR